MLDVEVHSHNDRVDAYFWRPIPDFRDKKGARKQRWEEKRGSCIPIAKHSHRLAFFTVSASAPLINVFGDPLAQQLSRDAGVLRGNRFPEGVDLNDTRIFFGEGRRLQIWRYNFPLDILWSA
jgi:hypothetical protein